MGYLTEFICFELGVAARKLNKYYNNIYSKYGITVPQSYILFSLKMLDGQNVKNLAESLLLESPAVTGLVDRLEKEGMVERRIDPYDRRAQQIFLTEKGESLAEKLIPVAKNFDNKIKAVFNEEEKKALKKLFEIIDDNVMSQ